ncbi:hypothetical protein N0V83_000581 [Neocucurbitaria cava]|uniref:Uncharacterized protein n=1 Tax=Neocucurbitaria cava TaxID=798079 RepID=A0A9W9CRB3_9PLEO|nr:hypothetical protein N0V83_000581 [Neocucurbitaria cava]
MSNTPSAGSASRSTTPSTRILPNNRRYAHIVPALNAIECTVASTATLPASPITTYHDTGTQTYPPRNGIEFEEIFGSVPTQHELEQKAGAAAINPYESGIAKPHELVYGAAIPVQQVSESKATYVDSGFQTSTFTVCQKALTRAKVKALMTANKYQRIAKEARYTVWAETKNEKVIHSEQYPVKVELDANGSVKSGVTTGTRIQNIYGEPNRGPSRKRKSDAMHSSRKRQKASDSEASRPLVALALSRRETDLNPDAMEDYGFEVQDCDDVKVPPRMPEAYQPQKTTIEKRKRETPDLEPLPVPTTLCQEQEPPTKKARRASPVSTEVSHREGVVKSEKVVEKVVEKVAEKVAEKVEGKVVKKVVEKRPRRVVREEIKRYDARESRKRLKR